MNELKEIVERLESYREDSFEVTYAEKNEEGWILKVRRLQKEDEKSSDKEE